MAGVVAFFLSLAVGGAAFCVFFLFKPLETVRKRLAAKAAQDGLEDIVFAQFAVVPLSGICAIYYLHNHHISFVFLLLSLFHRPLLTVFHGQAYLLEKSMPWIRNWRFALFDGIALATTSLVASVTTKTILH